MSELVTWGDRNWLWLLALIPLVGYALERSIAQRRARMEKFARERHWGLVAPEIDYGRLRTKAYVWLAGFVFLALALARPQWGVLEETVKVSGLDLMVAYDVSSSMLAEDVAPNRLKRSRFFVRELLGRLQGDRVGLVGFAGSGFLACPLTTDLDYVSDTLDIMDPQAVSTQGTDLANALDLATRALDRGAEDPQSQDGTAASAKGSRAILLITDGEDHGSGAEEAAERLKAEGIQLYVFGVGTEAGAQIPVRGEDGYLRGHKRDRGGAEVVSKLNPSSLTKIAQAAGGKYWTLGDTGRELNELTSSLGALARGELSERKVATRQERYQYPLAIGLLLLGLELFLLGRKRVANPGPRRSIPLGAASALKPPGVATGTALLILLLLPPRAQAEDWKSEWEAYRRNESGLRDFEAGRPEEARKRFGDAQALAPASPELGFNQGTAELKNGKNTEAAEQFSKAARMADQAGNPGLAGRAYFNEGNAWMANKDPARAVPAFIDAIERARAFGDEKLEADARKNLELMLRQPPQGSSGQSGKEGEKGKPDPDKKDDQKNDDQKNGDQKNDDKKNEDQNPGEPQRPDQGKGFKSEQLTQQAAEQVMRELARREKELQMSLKNRRGKAQPTGKDW